MQLLVGPRLIAVVQDFLLSSSSYAQLRLD